MAEDGVPARWLIQGNAEAASLDSLIDLTCQVVTARYDADERGAWYERYREMLRDRRFLPTTTVLMNAHRHGQMAGCVVLPIPHQLEDIFRRLVPEVAAALLAGTGVGLDLSVVAPRLCLEGPRGMRSPGPCEVVSAVVAATERVMSYAGVKRAAFMGSMSAWHPDIFEFIALKQSKHLPSLNTSVAVDDVFIEACERDGLSPFRWGRGEHAVELTVEALEEMQRIARVLSLPPPDLSIDGVNVWSASANAVVGTVLGAVPFVSARSVFSRLAASAHRIGEPGLLNLSAINRNNPTGTLVSDARPGTGLIHTTAPCAEQPLLEYESCLLGSINLTKFATEGGVAFSDLRTCAELATRFLDDALEIQSSPWPQTDVIVRANRKIGIGMMGLADLLAGLELPYDSQAAREVASEIARTIQESARAASEQLGRRRGHCHNLGESAAPRRHATLTSIAPTGNISLLAQCSSSIEPFFAVWRRIGGAVWTHPALKAKLYDAGYSMEEWLRESDRILVGNGEGTLSGLVEGVRDEALAERLKVFKVCFKTGQEISPNAQLAMVATLQQHVDNGISKTVALSAHADVAEVEQVFVTALRLGLKGVTVFRDGCRS